MTPEQLRAFEPLVKACVRRFTPESLPASLDRDDLTQTAWHALLRAEQTFDGSRGTLEVWVWVQMRGAVQDEVRRHRAGTKRERADEPSEFRDLGADPRSTSDTAQANIDMRELVQAVAGLPERERRVVVAKLNGQIDRHIAEELGVSKSRVSQLNSAACGRLRNQVAA